MSMFILHLSDFIALLASKTDLSLLLECLKLQMKCPDLQKQALVTIHSICEKRGNSENSNFSKIILFTHLGEEEKM